jgi:hypothetical protein
MASLFGPAIIRKDLKEISHFVDLGTLNKETKYIVFVFEQMVLKRQEVFEVIKYLQYSIKNIC